MEAYVLFARGKEVSAREAIGRCEEQEEDIGCPSSGSSSSSTSASDEVDLADDASWSGPAAHFEMASLMTQLPIKRGLSRFFDGKSQSFASLAAVGDLEDLPKPPAKRLKTSRSCGVGLKDAHRGRLSAASKKAASRARLSSSAATRRVVMRTRAPVAGQPLLFA
ncbi:hypothetical protein EJB05_39564 [Eragrostis curvula]|uniref:Uncharacterized protein n=1 Tax=Eragrostis curvula TaxID=38414 RepID=A0A5J9TXA0_9POAL|nr:hypothetical protein EJB05_39550 [Eragrostis curvula]TVU16017.1 hypothetical protein EJB05_39564 [Eragrostis curvula]